MRRKRRAKIVATVGPATASPAQLRQLFLAGVDTFRLNFSHGSRTEHAAVFAALRELEEEVQYPIGILQDLQGPKIRVGTIRNKALRVSQGDILRFVTSGTDGDASAIPLPHPEVFEALMPHQRILIDDGRVQLQVISLDDNSFSARVLVGGTISDRKGVNLPDAVLKLSPLTPKDRADLEFGLSLGVDWVALSFVQTAADVIEAKSLIGARAGLISKIEKPSALEHIEDIIRLSDGVMVARGDLGVELPEEDVPGRQKELVRACRQAGKPVIVATQMLESMVHSPTPTRAEASDVATAIFDGADAVMLSAESATGRYPIEAVTMMDRIIKRSEGHKYYRSLLLAVEPEIDTTASHAVANSAAELAETLSAAAVVAFTATGTTAMRVARRRPNVPILALTPTQQVARQLSLLWGAHSATVAEVKSAHEMVMQSVERVRVEGLASGDETIVIVAGVPFGSSGTTNNIRVAKMSELLPF